MWIMWIIVISIIAYLVIGIIILFIIFWKNNPTSASKTLDIASGFFGWTILVNLYFLVIGGYSLMDGPSRLALFLGLPNTIVPIIFFVTKRKWIGVGILSHILFNISIHMIAFLLIGFSNVAVTLETILGMLFAPFPLSLLLAMY